jgi:glycosyltransferase involved in cell wall biosynthesis
LEIAGKPGLNETVKEFRGKSSDMSISVLILTLNEESNLPGCLETVKWSDDIVVLDSYSSDRTCHIAKDAGARVIQRRFDDWSSHYNWAMEHIPFKYEWVFYLDADERMTEGIREEVVQIANQRRGCQVAYYCGRTNYFMGKWIRHAMPPGNIMRFFKPSFIRFQRLVNPIPVVGGPCGHLSNRIEHYTFSKGFAEWFHKHNGYSSLEAIENCNLLDHGSPDLSKLCSIDALVRRRAMKQCAVWLPCRALFKFLYLYLLNMGFLDGLPGLRYCILQAIYEYMTILKIDELQRKERGVPM